MNDENMKSKQHFNTRTPTHSKTIQIRCVYSSSRVVSWGKRPPPQPSVATLAPRVHPLCSSRRSCPPPGSSWRTAPPPAVPERMRPRRSFLCRGCLVRGRPVSFWSGCPSVTQRTTPTLNLRCRRRGRVRPSRRKAVAAAAHVAIVTDAELLLGTSWL